MRLVSSQRLDEPADGADGVELEPTWRRTIRPIRLASGFWIQDNSGGYRDDMITEACRSDGTLRFHGDHMEHMDYVWSIKDILCRHKVKGDIAFSSSDGDNAGTAWCYRFDGEGNCEELRQDLGSMWD